MFLKQGRTKTQKRTLFTPENPRNPYCRPEHLSLFVIATYSRPLLPLYLLKALPYCGDRLDSYVIDYGIDNRDENHRDKSSKNQAGCGYDS